MQNTTLKPKNPKNLQDTNKQTLEKTRALGTVASPEDRVRAVVVDTRPIRREKKDGNYEIHITIDRHDCHLLCLFIGVFTLSVLFNRNKRGSSFTSG